MKKNTKESKLISSSMRCPAIDIVPCLEKMSALLQRNNGAKMTLEKLCNDLGISKDSGYSGRLIASMKYYGFLEENTGEFKVNLDITDYVLEKKLTFDLILNAIRSVPVNKKIFSTYDIDDLPGENVVKSFLIRNCNYSVKKAQEYWIVFQKNIQLYRDLKLTKSEQFIQSSIVQSVSPQVQLSQMSVMQGGQPLVTEDIKSDAFILSFPACGQEVKFVFPKDILEMSLSDIEDLEDILELVSKKIARHKKTLE